MHPLTVRILVESARTGFTAKRIHTTLRAEGHTITYKTVLKIVRGRVPSETKFKKGKFSLSQKSRARKALLVMYSINPSITAKKAIKHLVRRVGCQFSLSTVKRLRAQAGLRKHSAKYCHFIRENNKVKRMQWCLEMKRRGETFIDSIFTDECTVQADPNKTLRIVSGGYKDKNRVAPLPKHPVKVHVYGGISWRGATQLFLFDGTDRMDSEKFCSIYEQTVHAFGQEKYYGRYKLVQDNAPVHTSRFTRARLAQLGVDVMDWPPESPDLNVIELVWAEMKNYVRNNCAGHTLSDLKTALYSFWGTLSKEKCRRYISHVPTAIDKVIEAKGGNFVE